MMLCHAFDSSHALLLFACAGVGGRAREDRHQKAKGGVSKRDWILHKKERARAQGKEGVKADTKYTGRKRPRF
jgi:hypothetical protein